MYWQGIDGRARNLRERRNAFRRRGVRLQSRSFARGNQSHGNRAGSRLLFLAEFLEARIIPERIEHWIEPEERGSERHAKPESA